ncbi:MAG: anaerobic ribonucleoside-triphosphate reductase activating protein [Prolixibacteraceae bacterium]|nr:anaerobic ribonucleoside-triphosphate reductase activating protein [Prolixibacteraceae bacterium]
MMDGIVEQCIPLGGFLPCTMVDYPSHISSMLFTSGCNMKCHYCHNSALIICRSCTVKDKEKWDEMIAYLLRHQKMIDAVVVSGGEPTIHADLPMMIRKIKSMGFKVKLDTNGTNPVMVERLIKEKQIDYVAMDIKAPLVWERYREIVGKQFTQEQMDGVIKTISILRYYDVEHEFRTTLSPRLSKEDIWAMMSAIHGKYWLQPLDGDMDSCGFLFDEKEVELAKSRYHVDLQYRT